ncbi:hypothetical protein BBG19_1356 [Francisella sp. MA067296]|nr:hypothetical protein BBG19_1356 [Francisella sp. MA067296]
MIIYLKSCKKISQEDFSNKSAKLVNVIKSILNHISKR